jgi:hypothetical protein
LGGNCFLGIWKLTKRRVLEWALFKILGVHPKSYMGFNDPQGLLDGGDSGMGVS